MLRRSFCLDGLSIYIPWMPVPLTPVAGERCAWLCYVISRTLCTIVTFDTTNR